jgi:hypothetical protein
MSRIKAGLFFKRGFSISSLGAAVVLIGSKYAPVIQIPGLVFLTVVSLYSLRGYPGILAHRMTASFKLLPSQFDKDK